MPDRELPEVLRDQLSAALEAGAPLAAPLPAQARFTTARRPLPAPRWRLRALTVAAAATGIAVVALAGPPQPREWIAQSMHGLEKQVGVPAGQVSPSPTQESEGTSGQRTESPHTSPEAGQEQSPEPRESAEPTQSPEPQESPGDGGSSSDGDNNPQPSPSPSPSSDGN